VQRIARSVADLSGAANVQVPHIAEAIQYRRVLSAS
jgi:magnesium chelatase family protein